MKSLPLLVALLIPSVALAEQYRWSDEAAVLHYADDLSKVPARYRTKVTIIPDRPKRSLTAAEANRLANEAIKKGEGERAITLLLPYAKRGDARSQYQVGHLYHKGKNISHKPERALFWYTESAEGGYHQAQFMLGTFYERGTGTARDSAKAIRWYQRAMENGSAYAPFRLAFLYKDGRGVEKNKEEADRLFLLSAERGYTPAAYELGITPPKRGVNVTNREEIRSRYSDGRIIASPVASNRRRVGSPPPAHIPSPASAEEKTTSGAEPVEGGGEPDLSAWLARLKAIDAAPSPSTTGRVTLAQMSQLLDHLLAALDDMNKLQAETTPPGAVPSIAIPSSREAKESIVTLGWIILGLILLNTIGWWRIFSKGGYYGFWALVPLVNFFPWLAIARKPAWWFLLLLIPGLGFVFYLIVNIEVAYRFGRGTLFGLGLTFLPFLFAPLLGLGPSRLAPPPSIPQRV